MAYTHLVCRTKFTSKNHNLQFIDDILKLQEYEILPEFTYPFGEMAEPVQPAFNVHTFADGAYCTVT